ncbi:MAG: (Fe-S)-binding protein [candidate division KSB1 bacterium]|nr:(Fe-S)-binding protein [candidate division KSB1 bacterium]
MADNLPWTTLREAALKEASRCNRCGYCQAVCPTYWATGRETAVARGRNQLLKAALEGEVRLSPRVRESVFQCLLCGACTGQCFPAVRTYEVMGYARVLVNNGRPSALQRFVFRELLLHRERLDRLVRLVALGKRSGLSGAVQALRILGWYGRSVAEGERLIPTIPPRFLRDEARPLLSAARENGAVDAVYFVGCAINYALPEAGLGTLRALRAAGMRVAVAPNLCCGLPAFAYGDWEAARALARRNLELLLALKPRTLVSDCASCTSFLQSYPSLLADQPDWREQAEQLAAVVRDATQLLAEVAQKWKMPTATRVTYHDPCHLAHHLGERSAPRELLRSVDGIELVEMEEADACCGGAGSYSVAHPDLAARILERKMARVRATGAEVVATACPACVIQLRYGARRFRVPVRVVHVSQLLTLGGIRPAGTRGIPLPHEKEVRP